MSRFKPFRIGSRVSSTCGASGRVIDFTAIGGEEYYIVQIGTSRREQIARRHCELAPA
jgi:hypothetical protein